MQPERDLVVIGAGAAGLSAAQHAAEANLDVLLVEEMASGGQSLAINRLVNFPGFPEPLSGVDFSMRLEKQTRGFGVAMLNNTVTALKREDDNFKLDTPKGEISCRAVILSTGSRTMKLMVPGEEEFTGRGVSYCAACDGPFFKNRRIMVVGGGDSACDEAVYLAGLSDRVTLIHRRDRLRARPALAARVTANPHITVHFNSAIREIRGQNKVQSVLIEDLLSGELREQDIDAVFVFIGASPRTDLVPHVKKDEAGRILTNGLMETSVPGLFAAGEVRNTPFRQLVVAAGEGAVAAMSAARYIAILKGEAYDS
mgnify:CR=1 FL=1